jgi:hypothetical protein
MSELIDITFDFRTDTPWGGDPDALSPTLRRYHQLLWGRHLPSGKSFALDASRSIRSRYLYHSSDLGEFTLTSDSIIATFTRWVRMKHIVSHFPESENEGFRAIAYTIGGMMIWPGSSAYGQSINLVRGSRADISDRMDLTVECVRRYYAGELSPLTDVLKANATFFRLFSDFGEFIEHFLLQDLVSKNYSQVRFFMDFDDFTGRSRPADVETYREYRRRSIEFVHARNSRIQDVARHLRTQS